MKIKILGTRANISTSAAIHTKHTGILIDDMIMFDVGERDFLLEKPGYIFITHLHPDHAFFQHPANGLVPASLPVYAPQNSNKAKTIKVVDENIMLHINGYRIIPVPVIHSLKVKSLGYIIENNFKRIFFSGDVAWIDKKYRNKFGKFDLVITEGSFYRKGGMIRRDKKSKKIFGHNGIPDLVKMFKPYTQHIVIIHLGKWFMKDVQKGEEKIRQLGTENFIVEAAYDGQIFEK